MVDTPQNGIGGDMVDFDASIGAENFDTAFDDAIDFGDEMNSAGDELGVYGGIEGDGSDEGAGAPQTFNSIDALAQGDTKSDGISDM